MDPPTPNKKKKKKQLLHAVQDRGMVRRVSKKESLYNDRFEK